MLLWYECTQMWHAITHDLLFSPLEGAGWNLELYGMHANKLREVEVHPLRTITENYCPLGRSRNESCFRYSAYKAFPPSTFIFLAKEVLGPFRDEFKNASFLGRPQKDRDCIIFLRSYARDDE